MMGYVLSGEIALKHSHYYYYSVYLIAVIMRAYLMLLAALSNAVCLHSAFFH